jgi:hypothetical protein
VIKQPLPALTVALDLAHRFVAGGFPQIAAAVLAAHLDAISPDDAAPDALLIDAAILLARTGRRADWAHYADRASRTAATDLQQMQRASDVLSALHRGEVTTPLPGDHPEAGGADAYQRAKQGLRVFDAAQELHRRGSCGEAARQGSRALEDFLNHHLEVFPVLAAPMITRFAAMLSACRRDSEARHLLAVHAAHLPRPGTPARHGFADDALKIMDQIDQRHAPHCLARHDSSRQFRAGVASGADGLPWNERRHNWRHLLAGDTETDSP